MTLHYIYASKGFIPDYTRRSFTSLCLMSHNLKIETERWSRVPPELRVCVCNEGKVEDEHLVVVISIPVNKI